MADLVVEAVVGALEARLGRMNAALSEADRLCAFYGSILEVCELAPAKNTHHLKNQIVPFLYVGTL